MSWKVNNFSMQEPRFGVMRANITLMEEGRHGRVATISTPIISMDEIDADLLKAAWEDRSVISIGPDAQILVDGRPVFRGVAVGGGLEPPTSGVTTHRSTG